MSGGTAKFVVVGGGTAGWLAALVLRDACKRRNLDIAVTVVDSSRISTIGVGEGTTAAFRMLLRNLGFDEMEFFRETEATVKFGIRHCDWRRTGEHYDGPIDDPHGVVTAPQDAPSEYLNSYAVAAGRSLQDMHLFGHLMTRGRSPYARRADGSLIPLGPFHYAYHFDQALVGRYFRVKAKDIEVVDATIANVDIDGASGAIAALRDGRRPQASRGFFYRCDRLSPSPHRRSARRQMDILRRLPASKPGDAVLDRYRAA